ncbi:MAG: hypothetical protein JNL32_03580 [Candidatus Kapabacteria bacterium]|nr:hypothetical protein [Candidatus Kapabacteria bacterium]
MKISKYKSTKYWAVWNGDDLICLTVYKKGAERVRELLDMKLPPGAVNHLTCPLLSRCIKAKPLNSLN